MANQIYKPEDLSTPTKRPTPGSGFIINNPKTIVLPDDQMDIDDDDDDDPNEISDEDLRGMDLPTVVQSPLKQQLHRKTKQQPAQTTGKELHSHPDEEEQAGDHPLSSTRKKYSEKLCSPESVEEASQAGSLPSEMETEIYDGRNALESKKKRSRQNTDDDDEEDEEDEEEEGDFPSSTSDVISETGSAKNMADFEDMSETEQQQTTTTTTTTTPSTRRLRMNPQLSEIISSTSIDHPARKRHESEANLASQTSSSSSSSSSTESSNGSSGNGNLDDDEINISNLSSPGQTLLWDLLQENSSHLPETLLNETERLFSQVLSSIEDKRILLHFIEACLDNLKKSTSSLISLRVLPKLFLIFQQHQQRANANIFLHFEERYHVLNVFFNDLEQLTKRLTSNTSPIVVHNEITVRFQFLTFIFSLSASPKELSKFHFIFPHPPMIFLLFIRSNSKSSRSIVGLSNQHNR